MLLDQLQEDLKQAQLARDEVKVSTLRLLLSEIKNAEIVLRQHAPPSEASSGQVKGPSAGGLSDEDLVSVVQKEVKKRKEAVLAFRNGGREEQAQKEEAEAKILEGYLPAQMQVEELTKIIENTINEVGAKGIADMGKVIGAVMGKVRGQADGGTVSSIVKEKLTLVSS